jgi:hypothetical protein
MPTYCPAVFADVARQSVGPIPFVYLLIGGGVCGVLLLLTAVLLIFVLRSGKKAPQPRDPLLEDLGDYPPPPPAKRRLLVQSRPGRLRLVVIAPVGKRILAAYGEPEDLLNKVVRGLGDMVKEDRARIRMWPPQLSLAGFAPTFFRNTRRPEDPRESARWMLAAGPAKAGDLPILLGIAVWSAEGNEPLQLSIEPHQWAEVLRIES